MKNYCNVIRKISNVIKRKQQSCGWGMNKEGKRNTIVKREERQMINVMNIKQRYTNTPLPPPPYTLHSHKREKQSSRQSDSMSVLKTNVNDDRVVYNR